MRRRGLDPITDLAAVRGLGDDIVTEYDEGALRSSLAPLADARTAARTVFDAGAGIRAAAAPPRRFGGRKVDQRVDWLSGWDRRRRDRQRLLESRCPDVRGMRGLR